MTYEVLVSEVPKQRVAAIRARTTISGIRGTMGAAYGELYAHLSSSGVASVGPPTAVYSEVDEVGVTVEICVPVSEHVAVTGRVVEDELPGQTVVTTLHRGPYEDLPKAYGALQEYMDVHGMVAAGPMREQYLSGPPNTSPEDYETRIQWPIGRAA